MEKIKVGAVSYLNTKPLLYGLKRSGLMDKIVLSEDYPSNVAAQLSDNKIDIGLVPVAIIPTIAQSKIVCDYGIATNGKVASVCIFSKVPMEEITHVMLDYQSRTSVKLAQWLLKNYWQKEVVFEKATNGYELTIGDTKAAVIIGDRALDLYYDFPYVYDLGEAWVKATRLPFVFAAWVANKPIDEAFVDAFNRANAYGLLHFEEIIRELPELRYPILTYYKENICFELGEQQKKGMQLFLNEIKANYFY
ncbi:MAG: menaquinone biosynthetic enzyme MqnA/MqnD family protein [Chitinophagaceae bacterium]